MSSVTLELLRGIFVDVALDENGEELLDFGRPVPFVRPEYIRSHNDHDAFVESLREDGDLSVLFWPPDADVSWTPTFNPAFLAERFVNGAVWELVRTGTDSPNVAIQWLGDCLDQLRGLVRGEGLKIPTLVGFGIDLPAESAIKTPVGTLRPIAPHDTTVFREAGLDHDVTRGSVLETHCHQTHLGIRPTDGPGTLRSPGLDDERWLRVALGIQLTLGPGCVKPVRPWAFVMMQPLGWGISSGSLQQFRTSGELTAGEIPDAERWCELASNPSIPSIAVRRVCSMSHRVGAAVDALIDSVIVWENLFGRGANQEVSYRVSMTMAAVLHDDGWERANAQQEIRKLYELRSRVVHGATDLNGSEALTASNRSQELTVLALRRLLVHHPRFLAAKPNEVVAFVLGADLDKSP